MSLSIENVIVVTITQAEKGLQSVNTSALALITNEAPISSSYGTYGIYKNATGVATDFGSNSETYRLAVIVFSQSTTVITGGGYLMVIPREQDAAAAAATLVSSSNANLLNMTEDDYYINVNVDGAGAADLLIGELDLTSLETAEDSLNSTAVVAAGLTFSLSGTLNSAKVTLTGTTTGASASLEVDLVSTGSDAGTALNLDGAASGADAGVERIKDCILRTAGSLNYFGMIYNEKLDDDVLTELAGTVQTLDKIQFVSSNLSADVSGIFTDLKDASYTHTRCLLHQDSEETAQDFAAAYASRLFSIDFSGSNTALTMHLKSLTGVDADDDMTETLLTKCQNAGVDFYGDFGVDKVFISGQNLFSDQIYSRLALKVDLQVAGFNCLAKTTTRIPQTESGMDALKGAYRVVMKKYVRCGIYAPGTWNGSTKYGDPEDHDRNIEESGFFIYSTPIADQDQDERKLRAAPLIQIAAKEAGAIHSSSVSVLIEA